MPFMSTLRMSEVTYDARDAGRLARFWAQALGWDVGPGASEYVATVGGPRRLSGSLPMLFVQVPDEKVGKVRIHLDLQADDLVAEVTRLVGLGATVVHEKTEWGHSWVTLQDPEGNEFCVARPDEAAAVSDGG
jgi:predicted enzyme related to lactoylglutathione lyase